MEEKLDKESTSATVSTSMMLIGTILLLASIHWIVSLAGVVFGATGLIYMFRKLN